MLNPSCRRTCTASGRRCPAPTQPGHCAAPRRQAPRTPAEPPHAPPRTLVGGPANDAAGGRAMLRDHGRLPCRQPARLRRDGSRMVVGSDSCMCKRPSPQSEVHLHFAMQLQRPQSQHDPKLHLLLLQCPDPSAKHEEASARASILWAATSQWEAPPRGTVPMAPPLPWTWLSVPGIPMMRWTQTLTPAPPQPQPCSETWNNCVPAEAELVAEHRSTSPFLVQPSACRTAPI